MKPRRVAFQLAVASLAITAASAQPRAIDTAQSVITVKVFKAGAFSVLGHDHEVAAPVAEGTADLTGLRVELRLRAADLRVLDPKASPKEREEIRKLMLGPGVLDAES